MNYAIIPIVKNNKILGFKFDSMFTFGTHVYKIRLKIYKHHKVFSWLNIEQVQGNPCLSRPLHFATHRG